MNGDAINGDRDDIAFQKGTPTQPGRNSPYRDRSVEENKRLFYQMKDGNFKEGEHVLRAKINMSSDILYISENEYDMLAIASSPLVYRN